jgi:hypothetical protein
MKAVEVDQRLPMPVNSIARRELVKVIEWSETRQEVMKFTKSSQEFCQLPT